VFTPAPMGSTPPEPEAQYAGRVTEPTTPMPASGWGQPAPEDAPPRRQRPPRRRRRGTKWLIALVILLALLIGADRIALLIAESQLASRIQSSQKLSQKPDVSISGFPFLTQVIARDFPHATVDIHGLDANGLTISDLHADLHGVHVNSGFNSATVDTLDATAQLSYTDIAKALTSQIKVAGAQIGTIQLSETGSDRLKASYKLLGVTFSASVDVSLVGTNTMEFKSAGFGPLVTPQGFDVKYTLGNLPFGIDLTKLTFTPSDVDIAATGKNVNLSQSEESNG
jgi:hypothetical protein